MLIPFGQKAAFLLSIFKNECGVTRLQRNWMFLGFEMPKTRVAHAFAKLRRSGVLSSKCMCVAAWQHAASSPTGLTLASGLVQLKLLFAIQSRTFVSFACFSCGWSAFIRRCPAGERGTVVARSPHGCCDQIGNELAVFATNKNANSEGSWELAFANDYQSRASSFRIAVRLAFMRACRLGAASSRCSGAAPFLFRARGGLLWPFLHTGKCRPPFQGSDRCCRGH